MASDVDELKFLSHAALALGEFGRDDDADVFRFVAEELARLAPDSLVMTASYEPNTSRIRVRAMVGPEDMVRAARETTGDPTGRVFRVDDQARAILSEGRLVRVEGGMHQLTFREMPAGAAQRLEMRLGVRAVFGQPFSRQGDFLGAVAFLSRSPTLAHARLIEVFVRLAAVAIQRQRAEAGLRESERRFRMLAENSQDVIFRMRITPGPQFEYVSPAVYRLTGYTPDEIYADARRGAPYLYPEDWTSEAELREIPGEPVVARCRRSNGTYVWTEQIFTPTRDESGRIVVLEGIVRDVTKRKIAEDAVVAADRRKTEFLAVLSHELRNPLGAISNAVYLLGHLEPAGEGASRARAVIERQVGQLTRLIDDLLDITRITRGKIVLKPEPIELNMLASTTVDDLRAVFTDADVAIDVRLAPRDVCVWADRARIHQVVANLLQNAAKFTPRGGRATIAVAIDEPRGQAVLRVHNSDTPIAPEVLAHLFEPFVQADRTLARSKGGIGLGLALVKGIVELHQGSVDVESNESGTAFTVRLPLETTRHEMVPATPQPAGAPAQHLRVLVIEDNVDAASSLREALELHANTVAVAKTGTEGIAMLRAFAPDVVLCDIGLPGMDGYEVARTMRADPTLHDVALVALSGYATPDDVERSRQAGFDRHVSKPPSIDALERVMSDLVAHAESR